MNVSLNFFVVCLHALVGEDGAADFLFQVGELNDLLNFIGSLKCMIGGVCFCCET